MVATENNEDKNTYNNNKRSLSEEDDNESKKKLKTFSASEFRKRLKDGDRLSALQDFLKSLHNDNKKHSTILSYLDNGGNCLELLQTLELDSAIPPQIVFEIVTHILLKITISSYHYQNAANEACRYLLSNYITVINKMIGLSSSTPERKACLRLLTAMVTFSPTFAKDVLIQVNFHTANMELLTKHTSEKNGVRDHFIHFLTSFFVDGHYPALSVLLDKKGFITSIISGLQFDDADTLCMVISAMRKYILENPSVSKTAKMKTFNTMVVKELVNLYNWKGPTAKKEKKSKNVELEVDPLAKSKVNECVHEFLLVLCTSHKFGVIFRDPLVGLGKKNQNALMYTVLESLDRPWDHSYASELVLKICGACPDLTKHVWNNLKSFLEPRDTQKWINAINFAKRLIKELQPDCVRHCIKDLNVHQLFQVIQCLVAPAPIIKAVIPDETNLTYAVKEQTVSLYLEMLQSLNAYLKELKTFLHAELHEKLTSFIRMYVKNNFPDPIKIFAGFKRIENKDGDADPEKCQSYVENILDMLHSYKNLSPHLLESLNSEEIVDLINEINNIFKDSEALPTIQLKGLNIFIDIDEMTFSINTDLFVSSLHLLFKFYYESQSLDALNLLQKLFINIGLFDGCEYEINIWINGIFNLKHYDENIIELVIKTLRNSHENSSMYLEKLSKNSEITVKNIAEIIEKLKNGELTKGNYITVKQRYISPVILGLFSTLQNIDLKKNVKSYVDFVITNLIHLQTELGMVSNILKESDSIDEHLKDYVMRWETCDDVCALNRSVGKLKIFSVYSEEFFQGDIAKFLDKTDVSIYPDLPLNLMTMSLFYLTNMLRNNVLSKIVSENCEKLLNSLIHKQFVDERYLDILLGNPLLLQNISFLSLHKDNASSNATRFLVNSVKHLSESGIAIERYMNVYREKLSNTILKLLRNYKKYLKLTQFDDVLNIFKISYIDCCKVLSTFSDSVETFDDCSTIILDIVSYCLQQISTYCKDNFVFKPIHSDIFASLVKYFVLLLESDSIEISEFSKYFLEYLELFPHHLSTIEPALFRGILKVSKYNQHIVKLAKLLIVNDNKHFEVILENLDEVCEKKWLILPLLESLSIKEIDQEVLLKIFEKFDTSLAKVLQKPQKSGQHFHHSYHGLQALVDACMTFEKCEAYFQKVKKFEVAEIFHADLLGTIYKKFLSSLSEKQTNNVILTFVHIQMTLFKSNLRHENDDGKIGSIAQVFHDILHDLKERKSDLDLKATGNNETVKLYFKFCLKYGISGRNVLLRTLRCFLQLVHTHIDDENAKLLMDMLLSHSEFLDKMLGEHTDTKLEILKLFNMLSETWTGLMERTHVPILLASYRAMVNKCDRTILAILKRYETSSDQTQFFDYKPFLWGPAAATHYSIRHNMENALLRQPKTGDILDNLQEHIVRSTIVNYPMKEDLHLNDTELLTSEDIPSYDVMFLLPLFSQILAAEQQVQTYKFTKSGGLSLTVLALCSRSEEIRKAACHVLARFHFHMEASQSGKDNLLWIRYIEAVCKGTAILPNFKLNCFSAIYLARMALILTHPNHVMYVPLSQHLLAKSSLDFGTIPELYTFLHSSDVNYKDHRSFILELLKDGLRTDKDYLDFERSMAFKLFMELYSSCLCDNETKIFVLNIISAACKIPIGVKMLCENHALLSILHNDVNLIVNSGSYKLDKEILEKLLVILLQILQVLQNLHSNFMIFSSMRLLCNRDILNNLSEKSKNIFFEIFYSIYNQCPQLIHEDFITLLLKISDDSLSQYYFDYKCGKSNINRFDKNSSIYFLRLLVVNYKR